MIIKKNFQITMVRKLVFLVPLFVLIILGVCNVAFSGQLVNQGEKIHALETSAIKLALQEKDLQTTLAGQQSLQKIQTEALAEGYIPRTSASYVDGTRPVALR